MFHSTPYTTPSSSASLLLHPFRPYINRIVIIIAQRGLLLLPPAWRLRSKTRRYFLSTTPDEIFGGKMFDIDSVQLFTGCCGGAIHIWGGEVAIQRMGGIPKRS
ncbi:hypothetical protein CEXT_375701 [Caerostris extrusa]|uniref:Uncharacterized protein n=1 Tax=Caerostris extrusa TaxID=172846 RepID=A0AAV4S114_CAEEX|nr:hypothetical protein CEXT_375701 [Caerostris extrusa]